MHVLQGVLPSTTELRSISNFHGDASQLEAAERFFLTISEVPAASERLACLVWQLDFPHALNELQSRVNVVEAACSEVRTSINLRRVLEVALNIGNQLNKLAGRPAVRGFSLRSLVKFSQTKSFDKKTTVLHVIAKYAVTNARGDGDLEAADEQPNDAATKWASLSNTFMHDMTSAMPACRIPIDALEIDLSQLRKKLKGVQAMLRDAPIMDTVWGPMRLFAESAGNKLHTMSNRVKDVKNAYSELVAYFAEDPDLKSEEFFQILQNFGKSFDSCVRDNENAAAAERRRAARQAAANEPRKRSTRKADASATASDSSQKSSVAGAAAPADPRSSLRKVEPQPVRRNRFGREMTQREILLAAISARGAQNKS